MLKTEPNAARRRHIDQFDIEAEAQGQAIRNFRLISVKGCKGRSHAKNKNGYEARPVANGGGNRWATIRLQRVG